MTGLGHIWKTGTRSRAMLYSIGKRSVVPVEQVTHSGLRANHSTRGTLHLKNIHDSYCSFLLNPFFSLDSFGRGFGYGVF